jgi:hypothetical protein
MSELSQEQFEQMFGRMPGVPNPEAAAAMEHFRQLATQQQVDERLAVVHWGALFCACPAYYDWTKAAMAPQQHCPLHHGLFWDPIGSRWL